MKGIFPFALCGIVILIGRHFYKVVRHEFYQVWDTIGELKGEKE